MIPTFLISAARRLAAGALLAGLAAGAAAADSTWNFDLQGHRGARGLAPENTLAAFRAALAAGVHTLELDVHVTRDGEVVVTHDPRLNAAFTRDADGRWISEPGPSVIEMTLAELQRFDVGRPNSGSRYAQQWPEQRASDGERLPTLGAVFEEVARRGAAQVRFNIETKLNPNNPELTPAAEPFVRAVLAVVQRHGMAARVSIQSFDWRTLEAVRKLAPQIPTVALSARQRFLDNIGDGRWTAGLALAAHGGSVPRMAKAVGAATWSPFHGDLTEPLLAEARALGLKVVPWTVNDPPIIERLLDWRVDGLITDYPDRVRAAMHKRGMPLPAAVR
ncbi:MAG: glycerophosphodiester phosphodiesterase [Betaproteobacteria bacterium]|nr:glycerophosphodiester phosphodiesterase [Betaproteobacteria bacterium]MCC6249752.1 glycerophosphodiester phosphodiesterase [Rubrivivax sp.]